MLRCCICNYTPQEGSDLLDIAPSHKIRVNWNEAHQGFYCSNCDDEIDDNLTSLITEDDEPNN